MNEIMKDKVWKKIRNVISKYEISCGESIYQASHIQDNISDILYEILSPLLEELEKINIEEVEDNNFDIDLLLKQEEK